jgi:hypothetical protein
MNSALRKLNLLAIIILLVASAGGCSRSSGNNPETPKGRDQVAEGGQTPKRDDPAKTGPAVPAKTAENSKTVAVVAKTGDNSNTAPGAGKTGNNSSTARERRQLLETIGNFTTAHCYQTYLNLGLLADGKAKGVYRDSDAHKVLDSVLVLLNSLDRKLAAVGKIDLEKQDRESLDAMRDLAGLLRQQGKELAVFWDSGKDEDAARYESTRRDSWAAIGRLTGIGR